MLYLRYLSYLRASPLFSTWTVLKRFYRLEAFARICVSGFLFDPEIPASSLVTSVFSSHPDIPSTTSSVPVSVSVTRQTSLSAPHGLSRGFSQRLAAFNRNLQRPFALSSQLSTVRYLNDPEPLPGDVSSTQFVEKTNPSRQQSQNSETPSHTKQPSFYLQSAASSKPRNDFISLPFKLSITQTHDKVHRNVPYLRHSWSRIDFVAICSFWVTFALATSGLERGSKHIGVFRAMSVVRTARLLTITSGTTVSFYANLLPQC